MDKPIATLMAKEMSRKEFIGVVGFGVASLFGFGTLLRMLGHSGFEAPQAPVASGFGAGSYGN